MVDRMLVPFEGDGSGVDDLSWGQQEIFAAMQRQRSWLPITLNVPGGVVHGDLIAGEAWKADWAQSVRQVESVSSGLLSRFPETVDQAVDELIGRPGAHHLPRWIHLRNVTLTTGGGGAAVELPVWRGRLADVAGWALGRPGEAR